MTLRPDPPHVQLAPPATFPPAHPPAVAISGYAAFGTAVSSDVLLNISGAPAVTKAANLMVVLHVAAGYQVCGGGVGGGLDARLGGNRTGQLQGAFTDSMQSGCCGGSAGGVDRCGC